MMPPTASAQTPGPDPVNAKVPPLADEPVALLPVAGLADVVPAAPPWLTLEPEDCEPELGVGAGTNEIRVVTWGSLGEESPNASTQESPAASCAAVGGQG